MNNENFVSFIENRYLGGTVTKIKLSGYNFEEEINSENPVAYIKANYSILKGKVTTSLDSSTSLQDLQRKFFVPPETNQTALVILPRSQPLTELPFRHVLIDVAWCPLLGNNVMVRPYARERGDWTLGGVKREIRWDSRYDGWSQVQDFFSNQNIMESDKSSFKKLKDLISTFSNPKHYFFGTIFRVFVPTEADFQRIPTYFHTFEDNFKGTVLNEGVHSNQGLAAAFAKATPFLITMTLRDYNDNNPSYTEYGTRYNFLRQLAGHGQLQLNKVEHARVFSKIKNQKPGNPPHPAASLPLDLIVEINKYICNPVPYGRLP